MLCIKTYTDKIDPTTLEKSHRTGGMGHISAFPYANFKSWECKMRASFCFFELA